MLPTLTSRRSFRLAPKILRKQPTNLDLPIKEKTHTQYTPTQFEALNLIPSFPFSTVSTD